MEVGEKKTEGLEKVLYQLLESQTTKNMDQGNLLIMLSLINLMGLIDIINVKYGVPLQNNIPVSGGVEKDILSEKAGGGGEDFKQEGDLNAQLMGLLGKLVKNSPQNSEDPKISVSNERESP